jgi:hypothetical protein
MQRRPFRLRLDQHFDFQVGVDCGTPLFRKVRHSFPGMPPTSFMTIVVAPLVIVPAAAVVPAPLMTAPVTTACITNEEIIRLVRYCMMAATQKFEYKKRVLRRIILRNEWHEMSLQEKNDWPSLNDDGIINLEME